MNIVDLVIILLLIFFAIEGWGRGFIAEVLYLVSFLISFFFSLLYYNFAAWLLQNNFQVPYSLAKVLGFIILWFLVETILFGVVQYILSRFKVFNIWDFKLRFFSVIPALIRGLVLITIFLVLLESFPIQPRIKQNINSSFLAPQIISQTQKLEAPLKNVFGGITADTLTFLTIKPRSDQSVNLGFTTKDFKPNVVLEDKMIELVNSERQKVGLNSLVFDQSLQSVARSHSIDMFSRGYFSHYSPEGETVADRALSSNVNFLVIGENLAFAPNLDLAHNGLMNSEGHRANILSSEFNKIGIGIMDDPSYGLMVTQVFSN